LILSLADPAGSELVCLFILVNGWLVILAQQKLLCDIQIHLRLVVSWRKLKAARTFLVLNLLVLLSFLGRLTTAKREKLINVD